VAKGIESPLLHLKPGTEEYKKVEAELIKQICEIDLGDESRFEWENWKRSPHEDHLKRLENLHKEALGIKR
tara:strand:+ start:109 stop:321 length:213 start_codon:yes stop_codon:yes gene_type:complete